MRAAVLNRALLACVGLSASLGLIGCGAPAWQEAPYDRVFQKTTVPRLHEAPTQRRKISDYWDIGEHTVFRPLGNAISPGYYIERAGAGPEAADVNDFDKVPDSPWFENRIGRHSLSPADVARGPNTLPGPADGPLLVLSGKVEGATPGFIVRDERGHEFVVKFDPPAYPGLSSSAEVISTKLLWAVGYHVPENYIAQVDPKRLALAPDAETRDKYNGRIPLTQRELANIIEQVNPFNDGTVRALFSRLVPGQLLGPFRYSGLDPLDPNDQIPHQNRRSLRGLRVFSAWLNNADTRGSNSMNSFQEVADGKGYIKHFLIDFGDSLGAKGARPKYIEEGYQHFVDWSEMGKLLFSFGFHYPYWVDVDRTAFRSVGIFEADVFDPGMWRPTYMNPAFEAATARDTFWAASILARLTPAHIAAAVRAGQYSEPGAEEYVTETLRARQLEVLRYAFRSMLPLDDLRVDGQQIVFKDLAVASGARRAPSVYRWRVAWSESDELVEIKESYDPRLDLGPFVRTLRAKWGDEFEARPFLRVFVSRQSGHDDGPSIEVRLRSVGGTLLPVGLIRETG